MIGDLKPYPEYNESDLPSVGEMPGHWKTRRMKFLFRERVQKGFPNEPLLAATQTKGVVRKEDFGERTVTVTKDFHLLKLVESGDFVISLRSFQGGIEMAHCRGIISPAYTVLAPQRESKVGYFNHFFKSSYFINSLSLFVTGIREGQNIDYIRLSRAYLPIPPEDEQIAIGKFLYYAKKVIEKSIRAKMKLIGLLTEQKQAIIHRAVTRGLDPNAPLKPSGIPWLGDIPKDWEVRRLKTLFKNVSDQTKTKRSGDVYIALEHVQSWTGRISLPAVEEKFESQVKYFCQNDILFGKLRPYLAKVARPQFCGVCVGEFLVLRANNNYVTPSFLEIRLRSKQFIDIVNASTVGAKMPRADWAFIGGVSIAFPPNQKDQEGIVRDIQERTDQLQILIDRTEHEVQLLQEYLIRLVADVVTGKLDVREAARNLPEVNYENRSIIEPEELSEESDFDGAAHGDEV